MSWKEMMSGRWGVFFASFIVFVLMFSYFPAAIGERDNVNGEGISIDLPKAEYMPGEPVQFSVYNSGNTTLEGTPSCRIVDTTGTTVFTYYFDQAISVWGPGQGITLTWGQTDDMGRPVPPGEYVIMASFGGYTATASILITDTPPQEDGFVHVLFPNGGEGFPAGEIKIDWEFGAPAVDIAGAGWTFELYYGLSEDINGDGFMDMPTEWVLIDTLTYNPSANPETQTYPAPYAWDATNVAEGMYFVKVVGIYYNYTFEDTSDGPFHIGNEPQPGPAMWIDSFYPDRDVYGVGDEGKLFVTITRGDDMLDVVLEGTCVVYYGPMDSNYIENRMEFPFQLPSGGSSIVLSAPFTPTVPSDYFAVTEIYNHADWSGDVNGTQPADVESAGPVDVARIEIHVEGGGDTYVDVWNPHDGDVVADRVVINWDTVINGARTTEGRANIYLLPVYYEAPPEPVEAYQADEPTYCGDCDGDGVNDTYDASPADPSVTEPAMPEVNDSYVIAEGIDNTGEFVWDSNEVKNFGYQVLVEVFLPDGMYLSGTSGVFFVANDIPVDEPNAMLVMFFTDKTEYNTGEGVIATAIIARNAPMDTYVNGYVNITVRNDMGDVVFRDSEYYLIEETGEFTTVVFPPFIPQDPGMYWITASIGDYVIKPVPMPEPIPEPVYYDGTDEPTNEAGVDGDGDGVVYYEDPDDADSTVTNIPEYMDWYRPNAITVTIFVHGDSEEEWHINLERPDDGDVMYGFDFILWTFDGPYGFDFGDDMLDGYDLAIPPEWYGESGYCGEGVEYGDGVVNSSETEAYYDETDASSGSDACTGGYMGEPVMCDEKEGEVASTGDPVYLGMPAPPMPMPWYGYGNLFVRLEYRPADSTGEWMPIGTVNANLHVLPWDTTMVPNGDYEMRITLLQYEYDFIAMEREMNESNAACSDMESYMMGEVPLAEQTVRFTVFNDDFWENWVEAYGGEDMPGCMEFKSDGRLMTGTAAKGADAIMGEIFAHREGMKPLLYAPGSSLMYNFIKDGLEVTVSSNSSQGKVIVLNVAPDKLGITVDDAVEIAKNIEVLFDGSPVEKTTLEDVISAPDRGETRPLYAIAVTTVNTTAGSEYNVKILVYIPHFSTHKVTVQKASPGSGSSSSPINMGDQPALLIGLLVAVSVVAVLLGALYVNERQKRKDEILARELAVVKREPETMDDEDEWERLI